MSERAAPPAAGEPIGPIAVTITAERIDAYAAASGDFNPIHVDPAFAATTEFGAPIAHGMLLLAYLSRALSARFGRAWAATGALEARFRAPALVGTTVVVQGSVDTVRAEAEGEQQVECSLTCALQDGGQVLVTATAQLTLDGTRAQICG
jgi:3-hydroxybutyryl-CoA dehydratase